MEKSNCEGVAVAETSTAASATATNSITDMYIWVSLAERTKLKILNIRF